MWERSFRKGRFKIKRGVTLLELLVVLIIVGILATVAVTIYSGSERNAQAAKARHALSLIAEAEKIYHSDNGAYLAVTTTDDFNALSNATGIDLNSVASDTDWNYTVSVSGSAATATATKVGAPCGGGTVELDLNSGTFTPAGGISGC